MAKVFKEEQVFHDRGSIIAIVAILLLVLIGLLVPYFEGKEFFPFQNLGIFLLALAGVFFVLTRVRMRLSISKKKIKVKIMPLPWRGFSHTRDEVEEVEFFKINEAVISSGLVVRFGDKTKNYYLGDRAGLVLKLKNGKNRVIFSDSLYLNRENISATLKEHGWPVALEADVVAR